MVRKYLARSGSVHTVDMIKHNPREYGLSPRLHGGDGEIKKIKGYLEPGEKVLLVAKQSRVRPGGSLTTPNIIFATDRKLVVRNPMMLGLRESVEVIPYSEITSIHLKKASSHPKLG